jgi:hypothetical protein
MKHDDLCNQPLDVHVEKGAVVLLGPDGVSLAMTIEAAEKSADLLRAAVDRARGRYPSRR